ncbi:MAG: translation initiation factor IF-2 subunit alpha [Desulfurococcaceae archaeon]
MILPRKDLPDTGELVVATVREIYDYGAYVTLDEYGELKAYLPWSEISSKWVRNIRDVIREGQKIVAKVIRVDRVKREVDVSLKRITESDKQRKMQWWKRYVKACKIVELVAERLNKKAEDAYREVIWKLEDKYYDVMYALEKSISEGPQVLRDAGVPELWINPLIEEASRHIKLKEVGVKYRLIVQSTKPDGVLRVRKCLEHVAEFLESRNTKFRLYVAGSPRYILEVYAADYRTAEPLAEQAIKEGQTIAEELGLLYLAEREKQ